MISRIAILGDFNPSYFTHHALNDSVKHCKIKYKNKIQCDWVDTDQFNPGIAFEGLYQGLWVAPGSPYKNMNNVLAAIKYARINLIPVLGNCGGFQHMIIEFARNVCGIGLADHEETNPGASELVISKLACSLLGEEEELSIREPVSLMYKIIGKRDFAGKYFCSYGVNKKYQGILSARGCLFTTFSADGQIRAFELKQHPFFLGTLFQPALSSTPGDPNPIIMEFFAKCIDFAHS